MANRGAMNHSHLEEALSKVLTFLNRTPYRAWKFPMSFWFCCGAPLPVTFPSQFDHRFKAGLNIGLPSAVINSLP